VPGPPINDDEVYDRLHRALLSLGRESGETVRGDTAINAARKALQLLQLGLVAAMERTAGAGEKSSTRDDAKSRGIYADPMQPGRCGRRQP